MLVDFFFRLRDGGVPVSITEFLLLLDALERRVGALDVDEFYWLARATLVKDERLFDRFDVAFGAHFRGQTERFDAMVRDVPDSWVRADAFRRFSAEERARIEALGGWDALMEELRRRLAEQRERHEGGRRWIGTGGTSPFGTGGYNPEGVRIGPAGGGGQRRAVKVWERREYRNLDDRVELGTRNLKLALRKLRRFAREGAAEELDLDGTIESTARNGGWLDVRMVPERHNAVKVLLFLDVGGSMDEHVRACEELFSAARSEFRHLEHFYFHNCVYERLWKDNRRRHTDHVPTAEVLRTYGADHRLIVVGDAAMSPWEIVQPGGSVEHANPEAGAVWIRRLVETWPHAAWLNPEPPGAWDFLPSIDLLRQLFGGRMFPLTPAGLDDAIAALRRPAREIFSPAEVAPGGDAERHPR